MKQRKCITIPRIGCGLGVLLAMSAQADIWVGRYEQAPLPDARAVSIFGDAMNGNTEPMSVLGGNNTALRFPTAMTHDPVAKEIYVSEFVSQKVLVFAQGARLDEAPLRSFNNALLGQPRDVVVDHAHNEIIVNSSSFILAFPIAANGAVGSLRNTTYLPSLIQNLGGMTFLPASDEIAVADYRTVASVNEGVIHFFPRTISGEPVESRFLAGSNTQLGEYVLDVFYDQNRNELIALAGNVDNGVSRNRLVTFAANASGNATPLRVISGLNTQLQYASALTLHPGTNEILVTNTVFGGGAPSILGFPVTANGNVAPSRIITDTSNMTSGQGWYGIAAFDANALFEDGFE